MVLEQRESSDWCWFEVKEELFQRDPKGILKISRRRKSQLFVLYQVDTDDPCCGLSVIFCGFTHMTGCKTINIPENFSGVHGFTGKTVNEVKIFLVYKCFSLLLFSVV